MLATNKLPQALITLLIYAGFGILLLVHANSERPFTQEGFNYDLMWLDAWALGFVLLLVVLWTARTSPSKRSILMLSALAVFGTVATAVIFSGTRFGENAFWGDQQFRLAMMTKFLAFWFPGDYYYKDLPLFYPPTYFWALSLWGRITGAQAYELLRTGYLLTWVIGPFALYWMWRKILPPTRAMIVVGATFLIDAGSTEYLIGGTYAFIANALFLPWWLYYVEQVGEQSRSRAAYFVVGGAIGALLFTTYFYPFFVLALLMILRWIPGLPLPKLSRSYRVARAWGVIGATALFTIPYWLPALISVLRYGSDRSRGDWFHEEITGITYPFLSFSWIGVLFLVGIVYVIWRSRRPIARLLAAFVGLLLLYYFVGSILGAMDIPLNLGKSKEFFWLLAGPIIGVFLAALIRYGRHSRLLRTVAVSASVLLVFVCLYGIGANARNSKDVLTARRAYVPDWGKSTTVTEAMKGKVLLGKETEFIAFHPVYTFIASNEHYSHPASRFMQRFELVKLLAESDDPYLFNVVMRHNQFDAVDYFRPDTDSGKLGVWVSVSNYPNRFYSHHIQFSRALLGDTALVRPLGEFDLYQIVPSDGGNRHLALSATSLTDTLESLNRILMLRDRLTDRGQRMIDAYLGATPFQFASGLKWPASHSYGKKICLISANGFRAQDSVRLYLTFRSNKIVTRNFRISLHVYPGPGSTDMRNFDFAPRIATQTWRPGDIMTFERTLPLLGPNMVIAVGLFDHDYVEGKEFVGQLDIGQ